MQYPVVLVEICWGEGRRHLLTENKPSSCDSMVFCTLDFGGLEESNANLCLPKERDFEPALYLDASLVGKADDNAQRDPSPSKQASDAILQR